MVMNHDDEVWIVDIDTHLSGDHDGDGFYTRLELDIDVDAEWEGRDVYAVITVESDSGIYDSRHQSTAIDTADFSVYNSGIGDSHWIELDFVEGYRPDYYDISVAIHDSWSHERLDEVGVYEMHNLRGLPLESDDHDDYHDFHIYHDYPVSGVTGHVGVHVTAAAADYSFLLFALALVLGRFMMTRRNRAVPAVALPWFPSRCTCR